MEPQDISDVDAAFGSLCHGLANELYPETFRAYKRLYRFGPTAIPHITKYLNEMEFSEMRRSVEFRFLNGLLSLLNDIDENQARDVGETIISIAHNPAVEQRVISICEFTITNFDEYTIDPLRVFEAKELGANGLIGDCLLRWISFVPPEDLEKLERVYVVPENDEAYLGTYMPILFNIMIVWSEYFGRGNPLNWASRLQVESTFYHEVGHHAHRHTFGNDPDQEREVDSYAKKLMARSHPRLRRVARFLRPVIR